MESEAGSGLLLTRFLHADRHPSSGQGRGHASLEKRYKPDAIFTSRNNFRSRAIRVNGGMRAAWSLAGLDAFANELQ
jgi:hypothetical protein